MDGMEALTGKEVLTNGGDWTQDIAKELIMDCKKNWMQTEEWEEGAHMQKGA